MTARLDPERPLYLEVAAALRREIAAGRHPVGTLLPAETELRDLFGVSRHTVREALRCLTELGLVTRRQGSGTQVVAQRPGGAYIQSLGSLDDLLQYAASTQLSLTLPGSDVQARGELAHLLGCTPGRRWRHYSGLRHEPGGSRPICITDVYLEPSVAEVEDELAQWGEAIYRLVERRCGITVAEVRQDIRALTLTPAHAVTLDVAPGVPGLRIVRRYLDAAGRTFEASVSIHPADRFTYTMRIRRDGTA